MPRKAFLKIWSTDPSSHACRYTWARTRSRARRSSSPLLKPLNLANMSESVYSREEEEIKMHQAHIYTCPPRSGQRRQRSDSGWQISYFLGHGKHWRLSLCVLHYPAIVGSINAPSRTSCHGPPSAVGTYRRGRVMIQGSGLWLLWAIHNLHIQINRERLLTALCLPLHFVRASPCLWEVLHTAVQSHNNTG